MAAGNTYVPIATTTVATQTTTVTFTSIPQTYTDLVCIVTGTVNGNGEPNILFNGDNGTNYGWVGLDGYGSGTYSSGLNTTARAVLGGWLTYWPNSATNTATTIVHLLGYSSTSIFKNWISQDNQGSQMVGMYAGTWRSTAAINQITFTFSNSGQFRVPSTVTLYGISAA